MATKDWKAVEHCEGVVKLVDKYEHQHSIAYKHKNEVIQMIKDGHTGYAVFDDHAGAEVHIRDFGDITSLKVWDSEASKVDTENSIDYDLDIQEAKERAGLSWKEGN